ncbi:hypothetical protein R3P38DRAFT_3201667 [Favolaschia claudopus]
MKEKSLPPSSPKLSRIAAAKRWRDIMDVRGGPAGGIVGREDETIRDEPTTSSSASRTVFFVALAARVEPASMSFQTPHDPRPLRAGTTAYTFAVDMPSGGPPVSVGGRRARFWSDDLGCGTGPQERERAEEEERKDADEEAEELK